MIIKLFILHFLADFVLQTRKMGQLKSSNWYYLFAHLAIQFAVFLPFTSVAFALGNAVIHGIIDRNIWNLYKLSVKARFGLDEKSGKDFKYYEDHMFYTTIGFDQLLHSVTLLMLASYLL